MGEEGNGGRVNPHSSCAIPANHADAEAPPWGTRGHEHPPVLITSHH